VAYQCIVKMQDVARKHNPVCSFTGTKVRYNIQSAKTTDTQSEITFSKHMQENDKRHSCAARLQLACKSQGIADHSLGGGARAACSTGVTFMAMAMLPLIFNFRKIKACTHRQAAVCHEHSCARVQASRSLSCASARLWWQQAKRQAQTYNLEVCARHHLSTL
jgi:hypothetical protein